MSCNVFANGNEVACKAGSGKVIAAFPDVCLSPPSPPAGPIPVPYPDSSFSKDTKSGTKKVKIKNKEAMKKNKSFYKSSPLGDEAATRSFGAGVVTHTITGKTHFVMWSMDVKYEGDNVDRHIDITTSNHQGQQPPQTPPMANMGMMAPPPGGTQGKLFCECCNEEVHSTAQAFGDDISEDEFYFPPDLSDDERELATEVIDMVRSGPCKDLMPPKPPGDDPCNKYYRADRKERKRAREKFSAAGRNPLSDPLGSRPQVYGKGQLGHRVPVGGGGCPVGSRNLHPVSAQCRDEEAFLGEIQGNAVKKGPPAYR